MAEAHTTAEPHGGSRVASPWPASAVFDDRGLAIGGVDAESLAQRYGTPLLVVDAADLRSRCCNARSAASRVLYAVKAFTAHAAIRIAMDEGLDVLAATGGEVEACLRAGGAGERIVLHGSNKSDDELRLAVSARLSLVVVDGDEELVRLDTIAREAGRAQPVLLRVIPEVDVATHEAIATGHEASKFGTPLSEAAGVAATAAALPGLRFEGLHAHVGSQVQETRPYLEALDALIDLSACLRRDHDVEVRMLDLGGGFAVTYVDELTLEIDDVAEALQSRLRSLSAQAGISLPELILEPGRSIVATTAVTLYRVGGCKRVGDGRTLVAVDGGMSDNPRPMLYDARYTVAPAGPPRPHSGTDTAVTVVGKHCESGDILAEEVSLPADVRRGDVLVFAGTGAYTYSLASSYNRAGRPAVVAVEDGRVTPWLRREDAGDMDRFETAAHRLEPAPVVLPGDIEIRPARAGDAASFRRMWAAIVEEGRYVRSERVTHPVREYRRRFRRASSGREAQIVAVQGDRVVGHLFVQRERHPVTSHVATLGIAVAADQRGRGIGSGLMTEAILWAHDAGVQKIVLSVYPHNTGAIALYRKYGFVEEGRLARQSRKAYGYEDEILMGAWVVGDGLSAGNE